MLVGTAVNVAAVVIGSLAGAFFIPGFSEALSRKVLQAISLAVILLGMTMAFKTNNMLIVIASMGLGAVTGHLLAIDARLDAMAHAIERRVSARRSEQGKVDAEAGPEGQPLASGQGLAEAFILPTLVFCVGPMSIMGALKDGLSGDHSTLFAKSILDGMTSIVFSSTMGIGVIFAAVPVGVYQGGISLLAQYISPVLSPAMLTELSAVGGLLIAAIGLNMLEVTDIPVADLLPAIVWAPLMVAAVHAWPF